MKRLVGGIDIGSEYHHIIIMSEYPKKGIMAAIKYIDEIFRKTLLDPIRDQFLGTLLSTLYNS